MRRRARSQAAVEFGAIVMIFVVLLCGIFDFGMLLTGWVSVTSAVSVAARQAATGTLLAGTTGIVATAQQSAAVPGVSQAALKVAAAYASDPNNVYCLAVSPLDGTTPAAPLGGAGGTTGLNGKPCKFTPMTALLGDALTVTLIADTFEVHTLPVRLAFAALNPDCSDGSKRCYVQISSSATVRYEGTLVP